MEHTHFWRNAGLIGIVLGAAILSAIMGATGHAAVLVAPAFHGLAA